MSDKETTTISGVEIPNEDRQPCEVWTRVMGYYRPVSHYNTGKKGEYHERVPFEEPHELKGIQKCQ